MIIHACKQYSMRNRRDTIAGSTAATIYFLNIRQNYETQSMNKQMHLLCTNRFGR